MTLEVAAADIQRPGREQYYGPEVFKLVKLVFETRNEGTNRIGTLKKSYKYACVSYCNTQGLI